MLENVAATFRPIRPDLPEAGDHRASFARIENVHRLLESRIESLHQPRNRLGLDLEHALRAFNRKLHSFFSTHLPPSNSRARAAIRRIRSSIG